MNLKALREKYPGATAFKFGDTEPLCTWLLELVRDGKKTTTCGALRDFVEGHEVLPVAGRKDIALNWDDTPALVIETVKVEQKRFCDIDEEFALKEGENEDLKGWRKDHQQYFERNGGVDDEMLLVCEHFKLIESVS